MRRSYFRFSLKTLLLVLTFAAIYLGLEANRVSKQRRALRIVESNGGNVRYDYEFDSRNKFDRNRSKLGTPGPAWLHSLFGEDYFRTLVNLSFENTTRLDDEELHQLSTLLPYIRSLYVTGNDITDDGISCLPKFKRLQKLSLAKTLVGDEGMGYVSQCTELRNLQLTDTQVTDAGMSQLSTLCNLGSIGLSRTKLSDKGVTFLIAASPEQLRWLNLSSTETTDAIVDQLMTLTTLDFINLQKTHVTYEGLAKLKTKFPQCMVIHESSLDRVLMQKMMKDPRYRPD